MQHAMSATNFEEIFYYEARKGNNLERKLFSTSSLVRLSNLIQKQKKSLKTSRNSKSKKRITYNLYGKQNTKIGLIDRKRKLVSQEMLKLEKLVNDGQYRINMGCYHCCPT